MKLKKFNGFDKNGYLPPGMYNMNLEKIEEIFSKNNSLKRREIMNEYKKHLQELKNTGYFIDHWINGSFITSQEHPQDIDTLTEFDGFEAEKNNDKETIKELLKNSKINTNNLCHSLGVFRYPPEEKSDYEYYIKSKIRILTTLFGYDRNGVSKGIIHLIGD